MGHDLVSRVVFHPANHQPAAVDRSHCSIFGGEVAQLVVSNLSLWKRLEFVSWDDDILNIWENKSHVPVTIIVDNIYSCRIYGWWKLKPVPNHPSVTFSLSPDLATDDVLGQELRLRLVGGVWADFSTAVELFGFWQTKTDSWNKHDLTRGA